MTDKFEVGEVVEIKCAGSKWREGTIVSTAYEYIYPGYGHDVMVNGMKCGTEDSKSGEFFAPFKYLRKKRPPQELSTWENVQDITNWNPTKVEA